ncbi:MAG TPA: biotin--[acetyl-CoA-carboxylase] ligase [bacterium]|jgi:BirA family biotin operon repressor/biotin-[acetyl-CoA-carboxylase] ligase
MSWDSKLFNLHLTTRRFGRESVWLEELDSTNRWLMENQAQFTMSGGIIVTDHQTSGRGRRERTWHDAPGDSLLFTVLLRHPADNTSLGFLSLTPAISLARVLHKRFGALHRVSVKWPNDAQINSRKVAGVLGQSVIHGMQSTSVVGVGINAYTRREDFPEECRDRSTSILAETGERVPREILLAEMLNQWEPLFDDLLERRFDVLTAHWESFGPARSSAITRQESGESITGTFEGLGSHGQLMLRDEQGALHELFTGDLTS